LHHLRITVTDIACSCTSTRTSSDFDFAAESPGDVEDPEVRADPTQLDGGLVFQINGILFGLRPVAEASALRLEPGPPDPRLPATSGTD
jgi:glyoxylase I family protein